ncbi:FxsA family protein [Streptomyces sp. NA02950]|uniref:FxsA family membrane protein n=1 Tax=Streptomyces sp. NA02950 TaxID=2742137 RepID=UPI001592180A|nr:FxsA family membrane protein [Streptomyces sp. NA02950]QKV97451.1 FxsA family protein [Streptomyces sp. NA02950]
MTGASQQSDPTRPKRSRARTFVPLGIAAWLVLEIWLLTVVARATGGLTVFLLLVAGVVVGAAVVRRGGRRAWQSLAQSMQPGADASKPAARPGSSFTMLGGLLLMMPGLISDVAALVCLFPPTRALLRRRAEGALSRRMGYVPGAPGDPFRQGRGQGRERAREGQVIQGEVIRDDQRGDGDRRADGGHGGPDTIRGEIRGDEDGPRSARRD